MKDKSEQCFIFVCRSDLAIKKKYIELDRSNSIISRFFILFLFILFYHLVINILIFSSPIIILRSNVENFILNEKRRWIEWLACESMLSSNLGFFLLVKLVHILFQHYSNSVLVESRIQNLSLIGEAGSQ